MQFIKTRVVKDPVRNPKENAGIDFFIPENNEEFRKALLSKNPKLFLNEANEIPDNTSYFTVASGEIVIAPHQAIIIPTGIRSKFSKRLALIANNKSGIATKKQLIFGASVIDCSYQGEWHINLINTSDEYQTLECGTKAVQFIPHLISTEKIKIVDKTPERFYKKKTKRGEGWQGSTGVK